MRISFSFLLTFLRQLACERKGSLHVHSTSGIFFFFWYYLASSLGLFTMFSIKETFPDFFLLFFNFFPPSLNYGCSVFQFGVKIVRIFWKLLLVVPKWFSWGYLFSILRTAWTEQFKIIFGNDSNVFWSIAFIVWMLLNYEILRCSIYKISDSYKIYWKRKREIVHVVTYIESFNECYEHRTLQNKVNKCNNMDFNCAV